jgi:hypothetical protein
MREQEAVVSHPRVRFVERVGGVFEEAGVNYAILHDWTAGHMLLELSSWKAR